MDSDIGSSFGFLIPLAIASIFLPIIFYVGSTGSINSIFKSPQPIGRFISAPVVRVSGENALLTNGHIINSYWCSPRDGTLVTLAQPGDRFVIQTERENGSTNECAVKILFPRTRKAAG